MACGCLSHVYYTSHPQASIPITSDGSFDLITWYNQRSINQQNSFMRQKIMFQSELFKRPDVVC